MSGELVHDPKPALGAVHVIYMILLSFEWLGLPGEDRNTVYKLVNTNLPGY